MLSKLFKDGIDPKWIMLLGLLINIEKGIGQGAISLANMVPDSWIPHIEAWNNGLAWGGVMVMTALAALCSNSPGPLINVPNIQLPSIDATKTVAKALLIAFAVSLLLAAPAMAQIKKPALTGNLPADIQIDLGLNQGPVKLTGNVSKDAQAIWDKIVAASNADLAYASKMAGIAGTSASAVRKQCYDAIYDLNTQVNGQNVKDASGNPIAKPDPHLFTDVESLAETIDNLSPQGKLFTSCAGMAQLTKTNTLTLINAIVTGAAGLAAMPVIPGL